MGVFREKAFHICSLIGELEFLRRLSQGSPRESLYKSDSNQVKNRGVSNDPLPLTNQEDTTTKTKEV